MLRWRMAVHGPKRRCKEENKKVNFLAKKKKAYVKRGLVQDEEANVGLGHDGCRAEPIGEQSDFCSQQDHHHPENGK